MTKTEFIDRWIGTPWEDRSIGPETIDCWGLVYVYYRDVLGIELSKPSDHVDIVQGFIGEVEGGDWIETDFAEDGIMFTAFHGNVARHSGIVISPTMVIHSYGGEGVHGSVSINNISVIERKFGKVRFFKKVTHGVSNLA